MDPTTAATSSLPLTIVVVSTLSVIVLALGGILWWFIRDRMHKQDTRTKEIEERRIREEEEHDKHEAEVQKYREQAEQERHQSTVNHYAAIEQRLKAGSETFRLLADEQKKANADHKKAVEKIEIRVTEAIVEWQKSAQDLRMSFLEAATKYITRTEFKEFLNQYESERKERDTRFEALQRSQQEVVVGMRTLGEKFETATKTINVAVGRLVDDRLACHHEQTKKSQT